MGKENRVKRDPIDKAAQLMNGIGAEDEILGRAAVTRVYEEIQKEKARTANQPTETIAKQSDVPTGADIREAMKEQYRSGDFER